MHTPQHMHTLSPPKGALHHAQPSGPRSVAALLEAYTSATVCDPQYTGKQCHNVALPSGANIQRT